MDLNNSNQNIPQHDELQPTRIRLSHLVVTTALVAGVLFSLALLYMRFSPCMVHDAPGVTLTDVHSINDLEARFNEAAGDTRLVLFVSPT